MKNNINLTLQSLFRHKLMTDKNYPDLLIKTESQILKNRLKSLSSDEKEFIENNFDSLYEKYIRESEMSDIMFAEQLNQKLLFLN